MAWHVLDSFVFALPGFSFLTHASELKMLTWSWHEGGGGPEGGLSYEH